MPERTVKRRLQDAGDAALASDDGPILSTIAKLVEALKRIACAAKPVAIRKIASRTICATASTRRDHLPQQGIVSRNQSADYRRTHILKLIGSTCNAR
jgi:hypothetical protein